MADAKKPMASTNEFRKKLVAMVKSLGPVTTRFPGEETIETTVTLFLANVVNGTLGMYYTPYPTDGGFGRVGYLRTVDEGGAQVKHTLWVEPESNL